MLLRAVVVFDPSNLLSDWPQSTPLRAHTNDRQYLLGNGAASVAISRVARETAQIKWSSNGTRTLFASSSSSDDGSALFPHLAGWRVYLLRSIFLPLSLCFADSPLLALSDRSPTLAKVAISYLATSYDSTIRLVRTLNMQVREVAECPPVGRHQSPKRTAVSILMESSLLKSPEEGQFCRVE